ncbi:MAG: alpha/beta hydrolase [Nitrospirales bacterium]
MRVTKDELKEGRFVVPYRVYGNAHQVLVCVSGAQQTMAVWLSVVRYFSPDYTVVIFDLPGQGRSRTLSGPPGASLEEQVAVLDRVISVTRNNGQINLAAASWGTVVAASYAAQHPGASDKLILASFGLKPSDALLEVIKDGQKLVDTNNGQRLGHLIIERFGQDIPDTYKHRIIEQFSNMGTDQLMAFYAHSESVENARHLSDFIDLHKIEAKTLIINGENDAILDLGDAASAAERIPNCQFRVLPGVGHFLHFECEDILDIYKEFLAC